jgi:hypothetical protein
MIATTLLASVLLSCPNSVLGGGISVPRPNPMLTGYAGSISKVVKVSWNSMTTYSNPLSAQDWNAETQTNPGSILLGPNQAVDDTWFYTLAGRPNSAPSLRQFIASNADAMGTKVPLGTDDFVLDHNERTAYVLRGTTLTEYSVLYTVANSGEWPLLRQVTLPQSAQGITMMPGGDRLLLGCRSADDFFFTVNKCDMTAVNTTIKCPSAARFPLWIPAAQEFWIPAGAEGIVRRNADLTSAGNNIAITVGNGAWDIAPMFEDRDIYVVSTNSDRLPVMELSSFATSKTVQYGSTITLPSRGATGVYARNIAFFCPSACVACATDPITRRPTCLDGLPFTKSPTVGCPTTTAPTAAPTPAPTLALATCGNRVALEASTDVVWDGVTLECPANRPYDARRQNIMVNSSDTAEQAIAKCCQALGISSAVTTSASACFLVLAAALTRLAC